MKIRIGGLEQACARHKSVRYGLVVVLVFGADEIKTGFMSSGDKTHLRMKLWKRKPGRGRGKDGQSCEKIEAVHVRPEAIWPGRWSRGCG